MKWRRNCNRLINFLQFVKNIINADAIAKMKPTAVPLNTVCSLVVDSEGWLLKLGKLVVAGVESSEIKFVNSYCIIESNSNK